MPMPVAETYSRPSASVFAPHMTHFELTNFRNHAAVALDCLPGPVILTGENGCGKTGLLEAVSLMGPGRGMRAARLGDITRRDVVGEHGWTVSGRVVTASGERQIGVGLDTQNGGRQLRIDGETAKGFDRLAAMLPQLWLTPAMDRLFADTPSARRRFLDRFAQGLVPTHGKILAAYERAMRERNRLLQAESAPPHERNDHDWTDYEADSDSDTGDTYIDTPIDMPVGYNRTDTEAAGYHSWLDALENRLAEYAIRIADTRLKALDMLAQALSEVDYDAFPRAEIALEGHIEGELRKRAGIEVEDAWRMQLARNRSADARAGRMLDGPHRSDLIVYHHDTHIPAADCSTGEQKALLVGLLLAQARVLAERTGLVPLLLLDEVAAHLDARRRAALCEIILDLGSQAWITGTDAALFTDFIHPHITHFNMQADNIGFQNIRQAHVR